MSALAPFHRDRLVKFLGMCGSAHDGERAAAPLKADELVRGLGLQWSDIVATPEPERRYSPPPPTPRPKAFQPGMDPAKLRQLFNDWHLATRQSKYCSAWEQHFLSSIPAVPKLTPKQQKVLNGIADSLRAAGFK
jgi:hypothetical protein